MAFDPCRPIHYVIRPDGKPPGGRGAIQAGIAEVSRATGLVFVDDGITFDEVEAPVLRGSVLGIGSPQAMSTRGLPGVQRVQAGFVMSLVWWCWMRRISGESNSDLAPPLYER